MFTITFSPSITSTSLITPLPSSTNLEKFVLPDLLNKFDVITPPTDASPANGSVCSLLLNVNDELSNMS